MLVCDQVGDIDVRFNSSGLFRVFQVVDCKKYILLASLVLHGGVSVLLADKEGFLVG